MKIMVDQEEIKRQLDDGVKAYSVAKMLDVPISVVNDINRGKSREFFHRIMKKNKEKYCSCCGFREKMPGARYLCFRCFRGQTEDVSFSEHICCAL